MTINFVPNTDKMKSNHRELKLAPMPGQSTKDQSGMTDNRLFKGENKLYCTMDPQVSLWSFSYDKGQIPLPLQSRWTTFASALKTAKDYFNKRNIEITEIVD